MESCSQFSAHADFYDRGLAALRRDGEGNTTLDHGVDFGPPRRLQLRILDRGKAVACSRQSPSLTTSENKIAHNILRARDSLFNEELHIELHREARLLLSHGVRCNGSKVVVPYNEQQQIEVDLINDSDTSVDEREDASLAASVTSRSLLLTLSILLSQAHRHNLAERSKPPAPLLGGSRPRPVFSLIKPILDSVAAGHDPMAMLAAIADRR